MKYDDELGLKIIKLSKTFAKNHKKYMNIYDSYDDYISELCFSAIKNINKFEPTKGSFATFCFLLFGNKIIRDVVKTIKEKEEVNYISLDYKISEDTCLSDILEAPSYGEYAVEEMLYAREIYNKISPFLSQEFKEYALEDKSITEIGNIHNKSKQNVFIKINREKQKLKDAITTNDFSKLKKKCLDLVNN